MKDDIRSILEAVRGVTRVDGFMRLVDVLADNEFEENLNLTASNLISLDYDCTARCLDLEKELCVMTNALCSQMGIDITIESVSERPWYVADILEVILYDLDNFDDYETPIKIIEDEGPTVAALCYIVGFVLGNTEDRYIDLVDNVYPRTIELIKTVLSNRENEHVVDLEVDEILAKHANYALNVYRGNPVTIFFENYGYLRSTETLVGNAMFGNNYSNVTEFIAIMLFTKRYTFDEAYHLIEPTLYMIYNSDDVLKYIKPISDELSKLYDGVRNEEA